MRKICACAVLFILISYVSSFFKSAARLHAKEFRLRSTIGTSHFEDVIPFISEHIQTADQLLIVGASSDISLQMARAGYGQQNTGFMLVIDENKEQIEKLQDEATKDDKLSPLLTTGKLKFAVTKLSKMSDICKQSVFDSILDFGGIDSVISSQGKESAIECIDHLQNAVRLGNVLVCISKLDRDTFCAPFDERFGWVQELDGDPGEISAWYRGKTNIEATKSNFQALGLKMFVYTNTDNC